MLLLQTGSIIVEKNACAAQKKHFSLSGGAVGAVAGTASGGVTMASGGVTMASGGVATVNRRVKRTAATLARAAAVVGIM